MSYSPREFHWGAGRLTGLSHCVDQAVIELTEIILLPTPKHWD